MLTKIIAGIAISIFLPLAAIAQSSESFFPHHVGDRWEYQDLKTGDLWIMNLTRDSIGADDSHNLFYNNSSIPSYRIDTSYNVFWMPENPFLNYLRYKLSADSCVAWENPGFGSIRWAWLARVDSAIVFSRPTVVKVYKYAPGNPCSLGSLEEDRLAAGFGLIYTWREPNDIIYLRGCIINGDTSGIITSVVDQIGEDIPATFSLHPSYPNPFNTETNIEFELPNDEYVGLKVFDILGREIETLYERNLSAGTYRFRWNATQVPSGIYFLRLSTPHGAQIRKMILMR